MKKKMMYIESDSLSPYFHLGLEYYLTTEKFFEDYTVLLFWRTTPTLVVGRYQNTLEEINREYAEKKGINIVRRLSGGGTVYYDQGGWQYSFISKDDKEEISFSEYMEPVIKALENLGVDASFTGRNDIVVDGKKVSGTAQYKHNGYTVHHGTLLYSVDLDEMVKSTSVNEHKIISKGIKSVRDRVTNIAEHIHSDIGIQGFKKQMVNSILGIDAECYELTEGDIQRINEIAIDKFDNWKCKFGSDPSCSITKTGWFEGGNVELQFEIQNGYIKNMVMYGDFFADMDKQYVEDALIGCEYSKSAIEKRLNEIELDRYLYKISIEDIITII